jgi:hypothetical protein
MKYEVRGKKDEVRGNFLPFTSYLLFVLPFTWIKLFSMLVFVLFSCDMGDSAGNGAGEEIPGEVWEWTRYQIPEMESYLTINTVSYAEGVGFIAGSGTDLQKPAIAVSPDGAEGSWTARELEGLKNYNSFAGKISRLNENFLMTRGSGVPYGLLSPDGEDWTETNIGFGTKAHVFANGVYVAGGQNGRAAWSADGMATWTALSDAQTTFDNGSMAQLYVIAAAYGNGVFVLGGGRGHTAVSTNGKTWTGAKGDASVSEAIFDGPNGFINCMAFFNGKFIALGGLDYQTSKSAYSADGVDWTRGGDAPGLTNNSDGPRMASGGGYIVAVSSSGNAAYSANGIDWTATKTGFGDTPVKDVAYGNGRFVIVGGDGKAGYFDVSEE